MKKIFNISIIYYLFVILFSFFIFTNFLFAQDVLPDLTYIQALEKFSNMFGEYKGIPKYGIMMLIVQFLMLTMKTKLAKKTKKYKLLIVSFLSLAIVIINCLINKFTLP